MERYRARTPFFLVLLIAAVMFVATTWIAAQVDLSMTSMEPIVAAALVAGVGGLRMIR